MDFSAIELWLIVGIALILLEFTAVSGIGLLFLGFGSLSTSILIYYLPEMQHYQIAAVGIASLVWFSILWWPLKTFVYGKKGSNQGYFDIIGMRVEVALKDIEPSKMGKVYWSGTVMNAKFIDQDTEHAKVGESLYVREVEGNTLICSRNKPSNAK